MPCYPGSDIITLKRLEIKGFKPERIEMVVNGGVRFKLDVAFLVVYETADIVKYYLLPFSQSEILPTSRPSL
jgi:hypothetical protein